MNWKGQGGWGAGSQYGRMYDPKTIETICGEVTKVERIIPVKGMSGGVHLTVKTDKEEIAVHLGPAWYIENQDMVIEQNDMIEVKGSRINFEGKPAIIAAHVKKDDAVLMLRNENGIPVWSGWRRK
ncbi:MAG: DNA-binding protein [Planctomycetes bacterium]|nr:DNA-binding protein [Planctomycetota bacterium]